MNPDKLDLVYKLRKNRVKATEWSETHSSSLFSKFLTPGKNQILVFVTSAHVSQVITTTAGLTCDTEITLLQKPRCVYPYMA